MGQASSLRLTASVKSSAQESSITLFLACRRPPTLQNCSVTGGGGLWIGTPARGLMHSYEGRTSLFTHKDGLSGDQVKALFEDREGTIWVGTNAGLDRFREL